MKYVLETITRFFKMVYITEQLIRNRAEHNNCELSTLEEVSLHQLDIEKIDHIEKWCRHLKILYLQSNLISKIENVSKLKQLEYLNLALNNVLVIENLEGCESLNKLDLTVNFIGQLSSVSRLRKNEFLKELYLTGNPCTDFLGYRDYVIATLPHLTHLDGKEISKSERIEAIQQLAELKCEIMRQEKSYMDKLTKEKAANGNQEDTDENKEENSTSDEDFWNKPTKYTPETRLEIHRHLEEQRKNNEKQKSMFSESTSYKRVVRYFNDDGRPYNINQSNVAFDLDEDDNYIILDLACYKHLDTSLIDVDIQPMYVRVLMKGKVFQLVLNEEVCPDSSSAQRSQTTGHLVIRMKKFKSTVNVGVKKTSVKNNVDSPINNKLKSKIEKLDVKENSKSLAVDIYNIVNEDQKVSKQTKKTGAEVVNKIRELAEMDFIDNPDVPPLI